MLGTLGDTMNARVALFALILGLSGPAVAQTPLIAFETGNDLLEKCRTQNPMCLGYVSGVIDASQMYQSAGTNRLVCPPTGVTRTQVRDVVVRFLEEHPESRQRAAAVIALSAMGKAFPCVQ